MVPRMNYFSRSTPPAILNSAAREFDRLVVDTFCRRMALPTLNDGARQQLVLPVRDGGFGLSSVQVVSAAAWYSAFANSFSRIRPLFNTLDTLTTDIPFVKSLSQCITYFKTLPFLESVLFLLLNSG